MPGPPWMGLVWLVDGWKMEGEGLRGGEAALWMGLVWLLEGWKIRGEGLRGGEACWCVGGEWTEVAGARGVCLCVPWAGGSRCSLGEGSGNLKQIGFYPAGGVISRLTVFFFFKQSHPRPWDRVRSLWPSGCCACPGSLPWASCCGCLPALCPQLLLCLQCCPCASLLKLSVAPVPRSRSRTL